MYKPFPIFDMNTGQYTRRDPWISPGDSFEEMTNCRLKRGVFEKRRGKSLFGQLVAVDTSDCDVSFSTNPVMGISNYLSGNTKIKETTQQIADL